MMRPTLLDNHIQEVLDSSLAGSSSTTIASKILAKVWTSPEVLKAIDLAYNTRIDIGAMGPNRAQIIRSALIEALNKESGE